MTAARKAGVRALWGARSELHLPGLRLGKEKGVQKSEVHHPGLRLGKNGHDTYISRQNRGGTPPPSPFGKIDRVEPQRPGPIFNPSPAEARRVRYYTGLQLGLGRNNERQNKIYHPGLGLSRRKDRQKSAIYHPGLEIERRRKSEIHLPVLWRKMEQEE